MNGSRIKRFQKPGRSDLDEALLKLFKQQRSESLSISGSILMINLFFPNLKRELMYFFSASLNGNLQLHKSNFITPKFRM